MAEELVRRGDGRKVYTLSLTGTLRHVTSRNGPANEQGAS